MANLGPWRSTGRLGGSWLPPLVRGVGAINDTLLTPLDQSLQLVSSVLQILSLILAARQDPLSVALRLAIEALTQILDRWGQTKVALHVAVIPPTNDATRPDALTGLMVHTTAAGAVLAYNLSSYIEGRDTGYASIDPVAAQLGDRIRRRHPSSAYRPSALDARVPADAPSGSVALDWSAGGLRGFFSSFAASVQDIEDPHRPAFADTAGVWSVMLLVGSPSLAALLRALTALYALLGRSYPSSGMSTILPAPRNLRVRRTRPTSGIAQVAGEVFEVGGFIGSRSFGLGLGYLAGEQAQSGIQTLLQVHWELPLLTASRVVRWVKTGSWLRIVSTSIYVSAKPFSSAHHGEGLAPFEVARKSGYWTSTILALPQSQECYVCATFDIELVEPDVPVSALLTDPDTQRVEFDASSQTYQRITRIDRAVRSSVVHVPRADRAGQRSTRPAGAAPNWYTVTGGAIDLLPPLRTGIELARNFLQDRLADVGTVYDDALAQVELLASVVAFVRPRVEAAQEALEELEAVLLLLSKVRLYAAQFLIPPGTSDAPGGTDGLVQAVQSSLFDTQMASQFGPRDLVAGVSLVAGAEASADLAALIELITGAGLVDTQIKSAVGDVFDPASYQAGVDADQLSSLTDLLDSYTQKTNEDAAALEEQTRRWTSEKSPDPQGQDADLSVHALLPGNAC